MAPRHGADVDSGDPCYHAQDWGYVKSDMVYIKSALDRIIQSTDGLNVRVRKVEDYQTRQTGFMGAVGLGASMLGALIMAGVNWLLRRQS